MFTINPIQNEQYLTLLFTLSSNKRQESCFVAAFRFIS